MPIRSSRGNGSDVIPSTMAELAFFLVFVFAMAWMIEAATAPAQSADNVAEAPTPILVPVILPIPSSGREPVQGSDGSAVEGNRAGADDATVQGAPIQTSLIAMLSAEGQASCLFEVAEFDPPLTDTTGRAAMAAQFSPSLTTRGLHGSFLEDEFPFWNAMRAAQGPALNPEARAVIWIYLDWDLPGQVRVKNNLRKVEQYVAYNDAGLARALEFLGAMGIADAEDTNLSEVGFRNTLSGARQHVRLTLDAQSETGCELKRVVRIRNVPGFSGDLRIAAFRRAATRLIDLDSGRYTRINDLIQSIESTMNGA